MVANLQGTLARVVDGFNIELSGAALSNVDNRYVDGLIQFGGPSGQIRGIMAWNSETRILSVEAPMDPVPLYIGMQIEISKWGEYHGELKTKALQAGKPPMLDDQTVEVEAGQKIVMSVNDAAPYATLMFEVLVGEASDLEAFFVAVQGQAALVVQMRDFDANRNENLVESARAFVSSSRGDSESEELLLVESGVGTGVFSAFLPLVFSSEAGNNNDGSLRGLPGDILNITYTDLEPTATYIITRALSFAAILDMPRPVFASDRPVLITVMDADLNLDRNAPDVAHGVAFLKVFPSGDSEPVTLVETAETSNIFTGQVEARLLETACCSPLWLQGRLSNHKSYDASVEKGYLFFTYYPLPNTFINVSLARAHTLT